MRSWTHFPTLATCCLPLSKALIYCLVLVQTRIRDEVVDSFSNFSNVLPSLKQSPYLLLSTCSKQGFVMRSGTQFPTSATCCLPFSKALIYCLVLVQTRIRDEVVDPFPNISIVLLSLEQSPYLLLSTCSNKKS